MEWSLTKLGSPDSDNLLEPSETFQITIANLESGTTNGLNPDLAERTTFNILVRNSKGAALQIERKMPKSIDQVMNLN